MNRVRSFVVALLAGLVSASAASDARATEPFANVGSYGGEVLNLPRGARNIGMGSTGTADVSRWATGYYNPASFAFTDAVTAVVSNDAWPADLNLIDTRLSGGFPLRPDSSSHWRYGGSLGYTRLDLHPQQVRTIYLPEGTGEFFDMDDYFVTASLAAAWAKSKVSIGVGGSVKYATFGLAMSKPSAWAFDLGTIATFPIEWRGALVRPRIGAATLNSGSDMQYDGRVVYLDHQTRGGIGLDIASPGVMVGRRAAPAVSVSADFDIYDRSSSAQSAKTYGAELSIVDVFQVRFGEVIFENRRRQHTTGAGLGWDAGSWLVHVDYAHVNDDLSLLDLDRDVWGASAGFRW